MRKRFKRVGAAVLSLAMIVGVMSAVTKPIEVQAANSAPGAAYWTDADGLGSFGMSSSDTTIAKIRFGLNGSDAREWAICGKDGNDLALLSTTGVKSEKVCKLFSVENDIKLPSSWPSF